VKIISFVATVIVVMSFILSGIFGEYIPSLLYKHDTGR